MVVPNGTEVDAVTFRGPRSVHEVRATVTLVCRTIGYKKTVPARRPFFIRLRSMVVSCQACPDPRSMNAAYKKLGIQRNGPYTSA